MTSEVSKPALVDSDTVATGSIFGSSTAATASVVAESSSDISIISKSSFPTPQSGHSQSSGTSSHGVPGAIPSSGQPFASS